MYLPRHFEETDPQRIHEFIRANPLATFVTTDAGGLCANHLPMLIESDGAGQFVLRGHVARANPLWKGLAANPEALAIFQDAGLYITPSWYPSKTETGQVVPTWNYAAVHVSGRARAVDDPRWLRSFLTRLTVTNESKRTLPWQVSDAPDDYISRQLRAIVGIELAITHIAGKWKVSQNRSAKDADGVVSGLREQGDASALQMADWVITRRPQS
jgi:transcriptional regulator